MCDPARLDIPRSGQRGVLAMPALLAESLPRSGAPTLRCPDPTSGALRGRRRPLTETLLDVARDWGSVRHENAPWRFGSGSAAFRYTGDPDGRTVDRGSLSTRDRLRDSSPVAAGAVTS